MRKISGLNEKMTTLLKPSKDEGPITFKEVLMNIVGIHRPDGNSDGAEKVKVTKLGLMVLGARDSMDLEGDYYDLVKKVVVNSKMYPDFILGQWLEKLDNAEEIKPKK